MDIKQLIEALTAEKPGIARNEIWLQVQGSYEYDMHRISFALDRMRRERDSRLGIESTFADRLILTEYFFEDDKPPTHWTVDWSYNENGMVVFDNWQEVTLDVVTTARNEATEAITALNEKHGIVRLDERIDTPVTLTKANEGMVKVAQRAGVINANGRRYSKPVLEAAVNEANDFIETYGPLPVDIEHRMDEFGQNKSDFLHICAGIGKLEINDAGEVSLRDMQFTTNETGQNIKALYEDGFRFTVSQRAFGKSHTVREGGKLIEVIDEIHFEGFDLIQPGKESVKHPDNIVLMEAEMEREEIQGMIDGAIATAIKPIEGTLDKVLKAVGPKPEAAKPEPKPTEPPAPKPEAKPEADDKIGSLSEQLQQETENRKRLEARLDAQERKERLGELKQTAIKVLAEAMNDDEKYVRFSPDLRSEIIANIDPALVLDNVANPHDGRAVLEALTPQFEREIARVDGYLAKAKLVNMGYPKMGSGSGITHVDDDARRDPIPSSQFIEAYQPQLRAVLESNVSDFRFKYPDDHPASKSVDKILKRFDEYNRFALIQEEEIIKRQLEARGTMQFNEATLQVDIGLAPKTISRVVLAEALRSLKMLQLMDVETMPTLTREWAIRTITPAETSDLAADLILAEPGEGAVGEINVTYPRFTMYATRQARRTSYGKKALYTLMGTPINLQLDVVASLSEWVLRYLDRRYHNQFIDQTLRYQATEVTSWEVANQVGSTNEWAAGGAAAVPGDRPFLPREWVKLLDANNNPTDAREINLYGYPVGSPDADLTLQALEVREGGGDNTVLIPTTDYTINFANGSVTLTASGVTKENSNGIEMQYTYATNVTTWDSVKGATETYEDYGFRFGDRMSLARNAIRNRHWDADAVILHENIGGKVANTPLMKADGPPNQGINPDGDPNRLGGLPQPVISNAAISQWIPIITRGSLKQGVQVPWTVEQTQIGTDGTRNFLLDGSSGSDMPQPEANRVIAVLNTAASGL